MTKAALAALLAVSAVVAPGLISHAGSALAQDAKPITIDDPAEFAMYDAASKQTVPAAQGAAYEAYLAKYPKSVLKQRILKLIMLDYSSVDPTKTLAAADNLLQVSPNDYQALVLEALDRYQMAQQMTDPTQAAARQDANDKAAGYATQALGAPKPADMTDAQYGQFKTQLTPTLNSIVANDAFAKQDYATAITAYQAELASAAPAQTSTPGPVLADTYLLGYAYSKSTPPDYVKCTFYATRAANFAPAEAKTAFQKTADFCYKRYHGAADGYDKVVAAASANLNPPADFSIVPAPSDADRAHTALTSTPDLSKMALEDREFVLQYGTQKDPATGVTDADKVFEAFKGKQVEIPGAIVVAATAGSLQVAVSDDAQQEKPPVADYTYTMKTPLKKIPAVGDKVTLVGTYSSYTSKPVMIMMNDGEIVPEKKAPVKKPTAPVHHH